MTERLRLAAAVSIVERLAGVLEPLDETDHCVFCGATTYAHDRACPWDVARIWVEGHKRSSR